MIKPTEPSIDNRQLMHSETIHCGDCDEPVTLAFTGKKEGINICCECHQVDTIPWHYPEDELPEQWFIARSGSTTHRSDSSNGGGQ